ncbi:MAG: hypothetical protein ACRDSP_01190 [Pseudonocardiaceae bacterium]
MTTSGSGTIRSAVGSCRDGHQAHVGLGDHRDAVEVEVHPAHRAQLADSQAGADREADQVGQVRAEGDRVGVHEREQPASLLRRQSARRGFAVPLGRLDAFEFAHRVDAQRVVQYCLLQDAADDRANGAAGVRCVPDLLRSSAVLVLDGAPSVGQPGEEVQRRL